MIHGRVLHVATQEISPRVCVVMPSLSSVSATKPAIIHTYINLSNGFFNIAFLRWKKQTNIPDKNPSLSCYYLYTYLTYIVNYGLL